MPFRSRMIGTGCVLTIVILMLPGCRSAQGGRVQGPKWSLWPSRAPRRAVNRPQVQQDPVVVYPNGTLPTPNPQFEGRPPVQTAPVPIVVPGPEPSPGDGDATSVPLPAPPRLQPQARKGAGPPLPELPDLSEVTPNLETTEKLPQVPLMNLAPDASADANFSPAPKPIPAKVPQTAIPRIAERPARERQPVHLEVPEADPIPADPIPADPFAEEPSSERVPPPDVAVPVPIEDDENLDLEPTPAAIPELDSAVETQSFEMDAADAVNPVDAASDALPPHSA
jgi:hypothetical protein